MGYKAARLTCIIGRNDLPSDPFSFFVSLTIIRCKVIWKWLNLPTTNTMARKTFIPLGEARLGSRSQV